MLWRVVCFAIIIRLMHRTTLRFLSRPLLAAGLVATLTLGLSLGTAAAQNCTPVYQSAFSQLRGLEGQASTQGAADSLTSAIFRTRPAVCEEGAYRYFMDGFEQFSREAMRAKPTSRDKLLRLAISTIRYAPIKVPGKDFKQAGTLFRQVRSNLNATADDVGFDKTVLLTQLLEALSQVGSPQAADEVPSDVITTITTIPPTGAPTTVTVPSPAVAPTPAPVPQPAGVQTVKVPAQPLPPWAVIKLYEMRDHVRAQDLASIQIKLQDILNWVETSTQGR